MRAKGGGQLWGDRRVLRLDYDGGYTTLRISQNSQNHTLKRMSFTVCQLYVNKLDFKNEGEVKHTGEMLYPRPCLRRLCVREQSQGPDKSCRPFTKRIHPPNLFSSGTFDEPLVR